MLRLRLEPEPQIREGEVVAPKGTGRWMVKMGKNFVTVRSEEDLEPGQRVLLARVGHAFYVVRPSGQAKSTKKRVYVKG